MENWLDLFDPILKVLTVIAILLSPWLTHRFTVKREKITKKTISDSEIINVNNQEDYHEELKKLVNYPNGLESIILDEKAILVFIFMVLFSVLLLAIVYIFAPSLLFGFVLVHLIFLMFAIQYLLLIKKSLEYSNKNWKHFVSVFKVIEKYEQQRLK